MPKVQFRRSLCRFSYRSPLGGVFVGYTRGIHGVFMGYTYVSGMCRVCIGYVSGMCRRRWGAKQGMLLTTDGHGWARKHEIYILGSVKVSEVQWSKYNRGKMFLSGRYINHGRARTGTETRRIYPFIQWCSVKFSGRNMTAERCISVGDDSNHGRARMGTETRSMF